MLNGYDLIAYNTDEVREKELRSIRSMQRARVDGVIATPFHVTPEDFSPLLENGVPVVIFGEMTIEAPDLPIDYIYVDDNAAAQTLVTYLVDRGLLPLAVISGSTESLRRELRVPAVRHVMTERALPYQEILAHGPRSHRARRLRRHATAARPLAAAAGGLCHQRHDGHRRDGGHPRGRDARSGGHRRGRVRRHHRGEAAQPTAHDRRPVPGTAGTAARPRCLFERLEGSVTGEGRRSRDAATS